MMNWISRTLVVTGVCVMTSVVGGEPVAAQQSPPPAVDKNAIVLIPGVQGGNTHDGEIRIGNDGQPARDHVAGGEDPTAGVRRILRLA